MGLLELLLLAVGLSMDAFAAAICAGLALPGVRVKNAVIVGLYFGGFQTGMPLVGYIAAGLFSEKIAAYDHWIALGLLCFLGGKMILDAFRKRGCPDRECPVERCTDRICPELEADSDSHSLSFRKMLPLAVATSIDALAIGVSLAFLQVKIIPAVLLIGTITFVISIAGVKAGNVFGIRFKSKAQFVGGAILVLIGLKIMLEHTGIIGF